MGFVLKMHYFFEGKQKDNFKKPNTSLHHTCSLKSRKAFPYSHNQGFFFAEYKHPRGGLSSVLILMHQPTPLSHSGVFLQPGPNGK